MDRLYRISDIESYLRVANFRPLDVLVVGGTGTGKSSTMNALFGEVVAKVGEGCEPETMELSPMKLNDEICFWDSPGLGDGVEKDKSHSEKLKNLLYRTYQLDHKEYGLIDMVLVILDGSGKDLGTTYRLLNDVIIPNFQASRILVAINQADMAMKGRHWDVINNCPDDTLQKYLEEKAESVHKRIKEATGVSIDPIFYSAEKNYHLEELLDMIIDHIPMGRRKLKV
mgnify:CR=1 FL=1